VRGLSSGEIEELALDEMKKSFKPEFLNRIDEIVVFQKLGTPQIESILEIQLNNLVERLQEQNLLLRVTAEAKSYLLSRGFDPLFGARPLRRVLEQEVENKIAAELVKVGRGKLGFVTGTQVIVDTKSEPPKELLVAIL
jgi:ATP-dependent Clp protease ATP-binding subunit ClpC